MVLGEMVMQSGRFKPESACKAYEDRTLEEQLDIAVQNINGEITEYTIEDVEENEVNYIPADPNVRNYSFTVVDGTIYYRENSVMILKKSSTDLTKYMINSLKSTDILTVEVTQQPFPMTAHISLFVLLKYSKMTNLNARRIYSQNELLSGILLKLTQIPPLRLTVSQ